MSEPHSENKNDHDTAPAESAAESLNAGDSTYGLDAAPSEPPASDPDDRCPKCGKPMPNADAVVCMHCGYDQVQNKVIKTKVGAVEVDENIGPREFVRAGRGGWKAPAIVALTLFVVAAVLSGMQATHRPFGHGVATFLFAPVFVGLGVAAVWLTALLMEERFGRFEHAAGRMMLAVAVVEFAWHASWNLELANSLKFLIGAVAGLGLYFLIVWWTFSLTRTVATMVSMLHLAFWAAFMGLLKLNAWLAVVPAAGEAAS